ncbi:MAG: Holliday junction branch migration protein RuvA [SAR202 cluster bacterium]|jgi:Holliday junction DNA helicase RuvA|nr:Holliday junction branch migration protein RuvA [SAR202 cluster bacterium]|tara:strand:- start:928 stop:1515 length:588 start_codon:yes stop_codon:yes gene_type:complete
MSLISSITGDITSTGIDWVDVNVGNFSLRVSVPASIADELSNTSESIQLFTSLRMRPENINLYGFLNEESRDLFEVLLNVNGVGPRHALGIMSSLTPEDLATAVEIGDVGAFGTVSGIGKKIASRIILELKGKMSSTLTHKQIDRSSHSQALEGLAALGYSTSEARQALGLVDIPNDATPEELVRLALAELIGSD